MKKYSDNYIRNKHPLLLRLISIWRILTVRNYILIDYEEFNGDGKRGRKFRTLTRTNYDGDSDSLTLKAAYLKSLNYVDKKPTK